MMAVQFPVTLNVTNNTTEPPEENMEIAAMCGGGVMLLASIGSLVTLIVNNRKRKDNKERSKFVMNMAYCITTSIAYVVLLGTMNGTAVQNSCAFAAAVMHFLMLSCSSMDSAREIFGVPFPPPGIDKCVFLIVMALGIPGLIVVIFAGGTHMADYKTRHTCWMSVNPGGMISMFVPMSLAAVLRWVITVCKLRKKTAANGDAADANVEAAPLASNANDEAENANGVAADTNVEVVNANGEAANRELQSSGQENNVPKTECQKARALCTVILPVFEVLSVSTMTMMSYQGAGPWEGLFTTSCVLEAAVIVAKYAVLENWKLWSKTESE